MLVYENKGNNMFEKMMENEIMGIISGMGDFGVFLGMFLESSIVPIPSEVIIIGAGMLKIPIHSITIFGSLGATLGAMVGYFIGRYGAMPLILKYGRFILIKPEYLLKAEEFAKKYGPVSVLIGRVIPVVPFKVFSIASGIIRLPFITFICFTLLGVIPSILLLSIFGAALVKYTKLTIVFLALGLLIFIAYKLIMKRFFKPVVVEENKS